MIRKQKGDDLDRIMEIWLEGNLKAHHFIDESYWKNNFESVRNMISSGEVYVYELNGIIAGFIGMMGDYIGGIFVDEKYQSKGIGKSLIDFVKDIKNQISLNVYIRNTRAIAFYKREGFSMEEESIDSNTSQPEYKMIWKK